MLSLNTAHCILFFRTKINSVLAMVQGTWSLLEETAVLQLLPFPAGFCSSKALRQKLKVENS